MPFVRLWLLAILACGMLGWSSWDAAAQPPWIDPGRDCRTLTTCSYTRGGIYRGCLSSYSCRVCRFVTARCYIGPETRVCQRLVCTWG